MAKVDHRAQQAFAVRASFGSHQKPAVELDLIELQILEISDRCVAGAEIVENDGRAGIPQAGEIVLCLRQIPQKSGLRDLHLETIHVQLLGERYELRRRDLAKLIIVPAGKRLIGDQPTCRKVDDRLENEVDPVM